MKNSVASTSVPSWVNFSFTGRKGDLFAASIPDMEEIVRFAVGKYYHQYRITKSEESQKRVREEVLSLKEILDFAVPNLTPLQRRGLLWGMIRNQYLFNIRHKLYENRGRHCDSIINIGYNSAWEYPNRSSEFWFWNDVPSGIKLSPSKEYPKY